MEPGSLLPEQVRIPCCIAGGGPAGMILAYLLARAGVEVIVLEKHADFLRDFRGDTLHPSTLETMSELGILEELLKRPHQKITRFGLEWAARICSSVRCAISERGAASWPLCRSGIFSTFSR